MPLLIRNLKSHCTSGWLTPFPLPRKWTCPKEVWSFSLNPRMEETCSVAAALLTENSCSCKPWRFLLLLQYNLPESDWHFIPFILSTYLYHHFCEINIECLHCYDYVNALSRWTSSLSVMCSFLESFFVFRRVGHCIIFHLFMIPLLLIHIQIPANCLNLFSKCSDFISFRNLFLYLWSASNLDQLIAMPGAYLLSWSHLPPSSLKFPLTFSCDGSSVSHILWLPVSWFTPLYWWITSSSGFLRRECVGHKLFETLHVCKYIYSTITLDWQFDWV